MPPSYDALHLRNQKEMDARLTAAHRRLAEQMALEVIRASGSDGLIPNQTNTREALRAAIWERILKPFYVGMGTDALKGAEPQSPFAKLLVEGITVATRIQAERQAAIVRRVCKDEEVAAWLLGPKPLGLLTLPTGALALSLAGIAFNPTRDTLGGLRGPDGRIDAPRAKAALVKPKGQYEAFHLFVDPRGYRLSDRIWNTGVEVRARVDRLMEFHIASGTSAVEIAKLLDPFMTPGGRVSKTKTPYGSEGSYAARRLARTEMTAASGRAVMAASAANPFVNGVQWRLSGSHRDIDQCDMNARGGPNGDGIYPPDQVPPYPNHPHELCSLLPVPATSSADLVQTLRADIQAARGSLIDAVGKGNPERGERLRGLLNPERLTKSLMDGTLDTTIADAVKKSAQRLPAGVRATAAAKVAAREAEVAAAAAKIVAEEAAAEDAAKVAFAEAETARVEVERVAAREAERIWLAEKAAEAKRIADAAAATAKAAAAAKAEASRMAAEKLVAEKAALDAARVEALRVAAEKAAADAARLMAEAASAARAMAAARVAAETARIAAAKATLDAAKIEAARIRKVEAAKTKRHEVAAAKKAAKLGPLPPAKVLRPVDDIAKEIADIDAEVERIRAKRRAGDPDTIADAAFMATRRKDKLDPLWAEWKKSGEEDDALKAWKPPAVGSAAAKVGATPKAYRAVLSLESEISSIELETARLGRKARRGETLTVAETDFLSRKDDLLVPLHSELSKSIDEDKTRTQRVPAALGRTVSGAVNLKYRPPAADVAALSERTRDDLIRRGVDADRALAALKELVDSSPVVINTPKNIMGFWRTGEERFKTQFETKTSMGANSNPARARAELPGIGFPINGPESERPVYGFVNVPGNAAASYAAGDGYAWTVKDNVRERMTMTMGDSLYPMGAGHQIATPMLDPGFEGVGSTYGQSDLVDYANSRRTAADQKRFMSGISYIEWQCQGQLQLSDIKSVSDPHNSFSAPDIKWLTDRGIAVTDRTRP